jgi:hypothetical protein
MIKYITLAREGLIMYFKNTDHKKLFEQYQTVADAGSNREYLSICYLLAGTGKALGKYIRNRNIDTGGIVAASAKWNSGEKALVKLAVNIFTDAGKANVNEVFKRLDNSNVLVALEGLTIRYRRTA